MRFFGVLVSETQPTASHLIGHNRVELRVKIKYVVNFVKIESSRNKLGIS